MVTEMICTVRSTATKPKPLLSERFFRSQIRTFLPIFGGFSPACEVIINRSEFERNAGGLPRESEHVNKQNPAHSVISDNGGMVVFRGDGLFGTKSKGALKADPP